MHSERARRKGFGDFPLDVFHGARITWYGDCRARIEGQRGVVELSQERVRLRTDNGVVAVIGEKLKLLELSLDAAVIDAGRIHTITYLRPDSR